MDRFPLFIYRFFPLLVFLPLLGACTSVGRIENPPVVQLPVGSERYSASHYRKDHDEGDTLLILAFSGGGTRAAALSYGVLEELRDTRYMENGRQMRLLDEVDRISSVSGGSFTAAYYGLFGDRIFEDFKDLFLYRDVQGELADLLLNVMDFLKRVFTDRSRTEIAIDYYDKHIFRGKTFADLRHSKGPFVLINASDLNSQSQFIFIQPQFDFLCSNLSDFKVARAVAASSAVPVLFDPILVQRYDDCNYPYPKWLKAAKEKAKAEDDQRLKEAVSALEFYLDRRNPPYATLVDGGVTDNLGLRTLLRSVALSGGVKKMYARRYSKRPLKRLAVIVVNASTTTATSIGKSRHLPRISDTLAAVTDIQLHLYNTETNSLLKQQLRDWAKTLSTPGHPIKPFFIDIDVTDIQDEKERLYFNQIPTSFSLQKEQADNLIALARRLLRQNTDYQRLVRELNADSIGN